MKKMFSLLALSLAIIGPSGFASAESVYFDFNGDMAADTNWQVADFANPIIADLYVDGIDLADGGLIGFGLNVSFDPLVAQAVAASVANPPWTLVLAPPVISSGNVLMEGLLNFTDPALSGTILLGSITMTATDSFTLTSSDKSPLSIDFGSETGFNYDNVIAFQSANVSAVPLPGAVFLLGSGLAGLAGLARRGKNIIS
ncbi:MAG: VPLPA-CTERM sorting domain-containing protein [Desulfobulbaceae bacterium]|nr:VPLPA-CTERM sorting domain-containing protein [Desulfobulbaceae bacterium]